MSSVSDIKNRLKKNLSRLKPWAEKHAIEAYRVYDRDLPDYPFIIDRYKNYFLVFDRRNEIDLDEKKRDHLSQITEAIQELEAPEEIILKRRERQRVDGNRAHQYGRLAKTDHRLVIQESQARFIVNLYDYLDTGLFLDHRLIRQKVHKFCRPGMRMLNLFSYTASVSVFAALAGAKTTSVDLSNTYSQWAMDNFRENKLNLKDHQFVTTDVLDFLDQTPQTDFDLIFLDPPTFSNSKKMDGTFEVERDQFSLVHQSSRWLKPGGLLLFSNNKRTFQLAPELRQEFQVREVSRDTLPFDFRDPKTRHVFEIRAKANNK